MIAHGYQSTRLPSEDFLKRGGKPLPHVTLAQVELLLEKCADQQETALVMLLWATAGRIGEIMRLNAGDVDLSQSSLTLTRLKKHRKQADETRYRRSRKADPHETEIPLSREVCRTIRQYINTYKLRDKDRLFPWGNSPTSAARTAQRRLARLGQEALGESIHPHLFRHGRAYEMVGRGLPAIVIAAALGHSDLRSVLVYYHPTQDDLRTAFIGSKDADKPAMILSS